MPSVTSALNALTFYASSPRVLLPLHDMLYDSQSECRGRA